MNPTIRSQSESLQITKTFEVSDTPHASAASPCLVYKFPDYQTALCAPARTKSVTDLIDRWGRNDTRKEGLKRARAQLARITGSNDELTIRSIRLEAGLSQTDLARSIGTSQPHIARIERGSAEPTLDTCRRLARALGVDLNTIDRALAPEGGAD